VPGEGSRSRLCRRGVAALGEVGLALAFGRIDCVVGAVLDIQSADATVHPTDNAMLADCFLPTGSRRSFQAERRVRVGEQQEMALTRVPSA
jgi:hypothetical protein